MGPVGPEGLREGTGILLRVNEDPMTALLCQVSSLDLSGTLLPLPDSFTCFSLKGGHHSSGNQYFRYNTITHCSGYLLHCSTIQI